MESPVSKNILLVNKPCGITSFDVIRIMQKRLCIKKIGHAGTLDPNATGLMILGINEGTKELSKLILNNKEYQAVIKLGIKTDSDDIDGKILDEKNVQVFEKDKVIEKCNLILGRKKYRVPNYSAIKINGKKMYDLARQGKEITPVFKEMEVFTIKDIEYEHPYIRFTVLVSKGTYIRSLVQYICEQLETIGTLYKLNRTKIGYFDLKNAVELDKQDVQNFINKKRR